MVYTITARNVNGAYLQGRLMLDQLGIHEGTRNGTALVLDEPVVTVYTHPWERVLFNGDRDANPYFHLLESAWMLAGMRDGAILDTLVHDFTSRFAEPGSTILHGAYGHRWRSHFSRPDHTCVHRDIDQLLEVGRMLRADPTTRRAVISMWDPETDLGVEARDLPCNTQLLFRVHSHRTLDMTVVNRSNDMIWGAYGANAVHMSFLHETVAMLARMRMGTMTTLSNNMHAYHDVLHKIPMPAVDDPDLSLYPMSSIQQPDYRDLDVDPEETLRSIGVFVRDWANGRSMTNLHYSSVFVKHTLLPAVVSHQAFKRGDYRLAHDVAEDIGAEDWRLACLRWLDRRRLRREQRGLKDNP